MFEMPSSVPSGLTHLQIAEKAKSHAWQHDHEKALALYREAMHLAQKEEVNPIFLRHYTECVLESLEAMGHYEDVLRYCDEAIAHYEKSPPQTKLAHCDLASIYERRAINAAKWGDVDMAKSACETAQQIAKSIEQVLPLTEKLYQWLRSGLHLSPERISSEQKRLGYFAVNVSPPVSRN